MKHSDNISTLAAALVKAQAKIGAAKKDSENPFFHSKYADLGQVIEACKEALLENGITVLQLVGSHGLTYFDDQGIEHCDGKGQDYLDTIILHESGEFISERMGLAISQQHNPQAVGSAITYARRYALQSAMLIPTEDDDAESAMKPVREDQAIGNRQERRELEATRIRRQNPRQVRNLDLEDADPYGEHGEVPASEKDIPNEPISYRPPNKGDVAAEQKIHEANKALLEARLSKIYPSEEQRGTPPPEKPVQANVERSETKSWQDAICTYGKKDGPLRGARMGDLNPKQLELVYTLFGKQDLGQIAPKDRLMAVAIRDWHDSLLDKEEIPF
jgi:ERF superfamily